MRCLHPQKLNTHAALCFAETLAFPVPEGPCCDNCAPDKFQVENITLVGGHSLKAGRKDKSSPELEMAVQKKLKEVRDKIVADHYPNQHFISAPVILADDIVDTLAKRARLVTSVDTLLDQVRWSQAARFGDLVVDAIQDVVLLFPDHAKAARELEAAERIQRTVDAAVAKELRGHLVAIFNGCYDAVESLCEPVPPPTQSGRKVRQPRKPKEPRKICKLFLKLPTSNVCPFVPSCAAFFIQPLAFPGLLRCRQKTHLHASYQNMVTKAYALSVYR